VPVAAKPTMRQLFGTDGIRGVAGEYPLDRKTVLAIGSALGARLKRTVASPKVLIGQDTRESSVWIAEALAEGLTASGATFASAGVITTPGIAYLTRTHGFQAGIVISASHNPWQDNGIKLFGPDGMKLADAIEHEIEQDIFAHIEELANVHGDVAKLTAEILPGDAALREDYVNWVKQSVEGSLLKGMHILADCANGAASSVAPQLFEKLGVKVDFLHISPDGRNINAGCGALHPDHVAQKIKASGDRYAMGVTFDGDADRALFSDKNGNVVNGDGVMLLAARAMKQNATLKGDTVVATTMSNMGLEKALGASGIRMTRANVGDKYVLEEMIKSGATLGGEQSGHILFMDGDATTGDGLLTALRVMEAVARAKRPLHELVADLKVFPQSIRNVHVREKVPFSQIPEVTAAIQSAEDELNGNGRIVVRYSGTEKLARVMIEAESEALMQKHVAAIADALQSAIGS
jgi:phosphoglucosamine mutase